MSKKERIGAKDLGLDLGEPTDGQLFKWLVACALFGARISQDIAARAYRELDQAGMLKPEELAGAEWQRLVDLLDAGGYARYDESTARELISLGRLAKDEYGGKISRLRDGADTRAALKKRLQEFKGVGPTAADIFLRDVAAAWGL